MHDHHVIRGAHEVFALKARSPALVFNEAYARRNVQSAAEDGDAIQVVHFHVYVAKGQVDLRPQPLAVLFHRPLRLGVFALHHQLAGKFKVIRGLGVGVIRGITAPEAVFI